MRVVAERLVSAPGNRPVPIERVIGVYPYVAVTTMPSARIITTP
jgi:hypothetical protein